RAPSAPRDLDVRAYGGARGILRPQRENRTRIRRRPRRLESGRALSCGTRRAAAPARGHPVPRPRSVRRDPGDIRRWPVCLCARIIDASTNCLVFTQLPDLAAERLGGAVLAANDEFFAPKEALLKPTKPEWREGVYTERGKWMDGWETRRRREPGYDWAIVRLGLAGVVRGVV